MNLFRDLIQSLSIALATFILGTSLPHLLQAGETPTLSAEHTILEKTAFRPASQTPQKTEFPEASLEDVLAAQEDSSALLVDARPSVFYNMGHLPKAINLPVEDSLPPLKHPSLQTPTPLIVYCSNRNCSDSIKVAQNLSPAFPNIRIFKEGWDVWETLGLPTEKAP